MDLAEYFGQDEHYFSESEGQLLKLEDMALPHVKYAMIKLWQTHPEFNNSRLHREMMHRLRPDPFEVEMLLKKYGTLSYWIGDDFPGMWPSIRAMAYRAGRRIGKKVSTHKKGDFLEITVVVPLTVKTH
jgi:hypothetical protein